ncbi:Lrp/AsnC family transcriptional regulator [Defluviimonas salinarum]|uniref:Lrp/AsnC family transcriptional regulator n=1 Tax=Defluviimonas salinarum TaxID=2992147 RepID=A0ABT3J7F4_9RHOB|nr:Lrp/AsnC family transcriptional regulator [Defluviimonas salinarum]MCW3783612.1 Lrp/AsnC family transcriptional regulator [Defluviimonas salinarum]
MARPLKLDAFDFAILRELQRNGRITKTALAERVNLSPSPCWERLKKLEKAGLITGYRAMIDIRAIAPVTEVLVEVTLAGHKAGDFRRFEQAVQGVEQIQACWATGGGIDYILRAVVADVDAYQRLMDVLLDSDLGIERYFGYIVTKTVKDIPEELPAAGR